MRHDPKEAPRFAQRTFLAHALLPEVAPMTLRSIPFLLLLLLPGACASSTSGTGGGSTSSSGGPANPAGTETCRQACAKFGGDCGARCDASCVDLGCASIAKNPDDVVGIRCDSSNIQFYYSTSQNSAQCSAAGSGTAREAQGEAATAKRIFITKATYDGDLAGAGGKATGLAGADALCEQAAASAELGGTWKAWLSDSTTDAIDRIDDASPWYNVDRSAILFPNKATLGTKPYDTFGPILLDETGGTVGSSALAWTGTQGGGRAADYVCNDWTSASTSVYGEYFTATSATLWNDGSFFKECFFSHALVCIEQ